VVDRHFYAWYITSLILRNKKGLLMSNMKLMFATIALASSVVFGGEIVVAENAEGLEGRTESAESVEETIGTPGSTVINLARIIR
jgi:hypothetical protein